MFTFYEVGGKVRDELLGLESKDIDYVVVSNSEDIEDYKENILLLFNKLSDYLKEEGYQIFLETPDCYTIRAKFPKGHINEVICADFVLARKEVGYKEGTREPIVVPGTLYDDLHRRDFTINAIAKDINGVLHDPFNGQEDLKNMILKTPIRGDITFTDDPLRLLRAFRFKITKGFRFDIDIFNYLQGFDYSNKFNVVSEERIREELYKCFKHNSLETIKLLCFFTELREYILTRTNLWLKPTNEKQ